MPDAPILKEALLVSVTLAMQVMGYLAKTSMNVKPDRVQLRQSVPIPKALLPALVTQATMGMVSLVRTFIQKVLNFKWP